jgi:hypothetical protein
MLLSRQAIGYGAGLEQYGPKALNPMPAMPIEIPSIPSSSTAAVKSILVPRIPTPVGNIPVIEIKLSVT